MRLDLLTGPPRVVGRPRSADDPSPEEGRFDYGIAVPSTGRFIPFATATPEDLEQDVARLRAQDPAERRKSLGYLDVPMWAVV